MEESEEHVEDQLDELRKKFIVKEEDHKKILENVLRKIIKYAYITEKGTVGLKISSLNQTERIILVLLARYIGGLLQESIPKEVTINEIMEYTSIDKKVIAARVNELVKRGYVKRLARGKYIVNGIFAAKNMLEKIEKGEKG